jgi:hypothetical protein
MTKRLLVAIAALFMIAAPAVLAPAHAVGGSSTHVDTVSPHRLTGVLPTYPMLTH